MEEGGAASHLASVVSSLWFHVLFVVEEEEGFANNKLFHCIFLLRRYQLNHRFFDSLHFCLEFGQFRTDESHILGVEIKRYLRN